MDFKLCLSWIWAITVCTLQFGLQALLMPGQKSWAFIYLLISCLLSIFRRTSSAQPAPPGRVPGTGEAVAEDAAGCLNPEGGMEPMSTGSEFLDRALVLHLNHCNRLLLVSAEWGSARNWDLTEYNLEYKRVTNSKWGKFAKGFNKQDSFWSV